MRYDKYSSKHAYNAKSYLYTTNLKEYILLTVFLRTKQQTALLEATFKRKETTMHEAHTVNLKCTQTQTGLLTLHSSEK